MSVLSSFRSAFSSLRAASLLSLLKPVLHAALNVLLFYLLVNYWSSATWGLPLFAEAIVQIFCSELNIFKLRRRQRQTEELIAAPGQLGLEEGKGLVLLSCVTSLVGYREDETVWRKCLESYRDNYDGCVRAVCMGIDGDDLEDRAMVQVAEKVFGADLIVVELDETFGSLADKMSSQAPSSSDDPASPLPLHEKSLPQVTVDEEEDDIIDTLVARASIILEANGALYNLGSTSVRPVCITQPHHSKKEIMFTTFIFSLAIARANDIDFLWSSDSDSWVFPGTLDTAIKSIYSDARIGGTATRFSIHNDSASTIATLAAATYEADFALQIGVLSSCNTTDCQPGPCALFRVSALTPILLPWYNQRILGHRPLINDDRHLTTRLLLTSHAVTSHPLALTATDTPTTIPSYILQQTRWARASFLEAAFYPRIFLLHHPLLCLATFRRFYLPALNIWIVIHYLTSGQSAGFSSLPDVALRLATAGVYSALRMGGGWTSVPRLRASMLLFQVPQAAFQVWAAASAFENGWGTEGRSEGERRRKGAWEWGKVGPVWVTGLWLGAVGGAMAKGVAVALGVGGMGGLGEEVVAGVVAGVGFVVVVVLFAVAVWRGA